MLCAKVGDLLNVGGTAIQTTPQTSVAFNGVLLAVVGATVNDHGSGLHNGPTFPTGSATFRIGGLAVVRNSEPATCGHLAIATALIDVSA